jgi:hypothetical protein
MQLRELAVVWSCAGLISACAARDDMGSDMSSDLSSEIRADGREVVIRSSDPVAAGDPAALATAAGRGLSQRAYVKASNTDAGDVFGVSVALSADGSTLAVGAVGEASAASGVGGDQADDSLTTAGAVYVFRRHGKRWIQQAYLKASNPDAYDSFGVSVALSADGSTLAVGASGEDSADGGVGGDQADNSINDAGAVYVFQRHGTTWAQEAYLKASSPGVIDYFGYSVSLSADGTTLAVGAWGEDSAATGIDGDQSDDSASYAGAAYVFERHGATWCQQAYVKASDTAVGDFFGYSVALSADGATLAVGAWAERSAATGIGADPTDDSAPWAGAVYVFARSGARWRQQAYVKATNTDSYDYFGMRVALSADGSTLAVSAPGEGSAATGVDGDQADDSAPYAGAVYIFARSGATWREEAYVKASNTELGDELGSSIALSCDGSKLVVGALDEDSAATGVGGDQSDNSIWGAGAVYVFARSGATWSQEAYVKASNTGAGDLFGWSVALSCDGSILAASAGYEDSVATGIDGDQADDSANAAGAVYVFDRLPARQ